MIILPGLNYVYKSYGLFLSNSRKNASKHYKFMYYILPNEASLSKALRGVYKTLTLISIPPAEGLLETFSLFHRITHAKVYTKLKLMVSWSDSIFSQIKTSSFRLMFC